jgi:3-deoxy-manno-octulosonate cytidylyltransferase (CMP-KDO synthetase)
MKAVCLIPARYGSTRFPAKILARETGKYLVQHVYEQAKKAACFSQVIVAADDERIVAAVRSFGGEVRLTRADHPTGTDRIAEVAATLDAPVIVNLQGDEPRVPPALLEQLVSLLDRDRDAVCATLAARCRSLDEVLSPNVVKVVCDSRGHALYFSRSAIPFDRAAHLSGRPLLPANYLKHIGLYAYRRDFLLAFSKMLQTPLEKLESLEQLRTLESGRAIAVAEVDFDSRGIDTPEDYADFVTEMKTIGLLQNSIMSADLKRNEVAIDVDIVKCKDRIAGIKEKMKQDISDFDRANCNADLAEQKDRLKNLQKERKRLETPMGADDGSMGWFGGKL